MAKYFQDLREKKKTVNQEYETQQKISFRNKGEIKTMCDEGKLTEIVTNRPTILKKKKRLKNILKTERNM